MSAYLEDLGFIEKPAAFKPRPPSSRFEGVHEDGSRWYGTVLRADGKRVDLYAETQAEAITKARNYAAKGGGR